MPNKSNLQTSAAEDQDLRARLENAEESLREILSGETDALFVPGVGGRQLFALKGADQSYRTLIENMSEGALTLTPEGLILYANRRFAEMLRTPLEKVIGSEIHTWFAPESRQVLQTLLRKDAVDNRREELALAAADGTQVPVNLSVSHLLLDEMPDSFCMVATDLTAHKQAEQALRESAEKLRLFADNVPAMTVSFDENLRCLFANKRYADFFRLSATDIIGKHLREIIGESDYSEIEGHFVQVLQGHPVTYERTLKLPSGEPGYVEVKLLPHIGAQGNTLGCFAVMTDITEHKLTEERIQRVAHHDSLTGLPNRLLFNDRLEQAIRLAKRSSRQFALLYLDLDRFKRVNDTLGHTAGDELLQAVAARIRQQVRESDTVARVGGDEFAMILPDIASRDDVETVAKKIIAAVAMPFPLGSQKQNVDIGTSIGIALYPADAQDADALVKVADAAMYGAKQKRV